MTQALIRIGTRKSPLAMAQAEEVKAQLLEFNPDLNIELVTFTTSGDKFLGALSEVGGKGLFTKELEEALLSRNIDIAVHSMKDMATVLPDGLIVGAMLEREDPRDVLVGEGLSSLDDLPEGARFGTSSLRRSAQIKLIRPDLEIVPFRGNVQTRLTKLKEGEVRATMLARAGLNRLGLYDIPGISLPVDVFLPAVAQGAVGIECREDDTVVLELIATLADVETETAVLCERSFLAVLDGSCRTPIAGYALIDGEELSFHGKITRPDGSESHEISCTGAAIDAAEIGIRAGEELLAKAGDDFF